MEYQASCSCPHNKVQLSLILPKAIEQYQPRACDCDFCVALDLAYLSDPAGQLDVFNSRNIEYAQQGSEQALFARCKTCHSLLFVSYEFASGIKGAINAKLLADNYALTEPISVSPKTLLPDEKLERWQATWLPLNLWP